MKFVATSRAWVSPEKLGTKFVTCNDTMYVTMLDVDGGLMQKDVQKALITMMI